jgi:hypothetical protein
MELLLENRRISRFTCRNFAAIIVNYRSISLFFLRWLFQDSIDALARNQQRGLDSSLYNKANELQEDISMKKFDLRAKQIHLSAVRAQVSEWRRNVKIIGRVGMFEKDDQVWDSRIDEIKRAIIELSVCFGSFHSKAFYITCRQKL